MTTSSIVIGDDGTTTSIQIQRPDGTALTTSLPTYPVANQANAQTIAARANTALTNNVAYLGIASPTNAQVVAQVAALTRQVDGLIRFVLGRFESVADA